MKLPKKQISNVRSYCDLNNIEDIDGFILQCFTDGYNIKKYGLIGDTTDSKIIEKEVEKIIEVVKEVKVPFEVIKEVEKIIEVPVEIIKEVEKVIEVPVEVIKEVEKVIEVPTKSIQETEVKNDCDECEKEKNILSEKLKLSEEKTILNSSDNQKKLQETLNKLRKELSEKNDTINKLNKIIKESENNSKPVGAVYLKGSNLNN